MKLCTSCSHPFSYCLTMVLKPDVSGSHMLSPSSYIPENLHFCTKETL